MHAGVCHEIRTRIEAGDVDENLDAGLCAAARNLAGVIDRASGLGGRKPDTYAVPGLQRELTALLTLLSGRALAAPDSSWLEDDEPPPPDAGRVDDSSSS